MRPTTQTPGDLSPLPQLLDSAQRSALCQHETTAALNAFASCLAHPADRCPGEASGRQSLRVPYTAGRLLRSPSSYLT